MLITRGHDNMAYVAAVAIVSGLFDRGRCMTTRQ